MQRSSNRSGNTQPLSNDALQPAHSLTEDVLRESELAEAGQNEGGRDIFGENKHDRGDLRTSNSETIDDGVEPGVINAPNPATQANTTPKHRHASMPTGVKRPKSTRRYVIPITIHPSPILQRLHISATGLGVLSLVYVPIATDAAWWISALLLLPLLVSGVRTQRAISHPVKLLIHPDDTVQLINQAYGSAATGSQAHRPTGSLRAVLVRQFHCDAFIVLGFQNTAQYPQTREVFSQVNTIIVARDATDSATYSAIRRWLFLSNIHTTQ